MVMDIMIAPANFEDMVCNMAKVKIEFELDEEVVNFIRKASMCEPDINQLVYYDRFILDNLYTFYMHLIHLISHADKKMIFVDGLTYHDYYTIQLNQLFLDAFSEYIDEVSPDV